MANESELWIEVGQGKAIRLRVSIVEQLIPTPNEPDTERELTASEFLQFFAPIAGEVTIHKPF